MRHDIAVLRAEVQKWLPVFKASLGTSQNEFARGAGVDQSIFSRWLRGTITSAPTAAKAERHLGRMKQRLGVRERAS